MKKAERRWWLVICLWVLVGGSTFPSGALAATCEVGDLGKGYWKMEGPPNQGKCIIPGPPHPDSGFLQGRGWNGAFRIEGKYKVVTTLGAKGFYWTCPECVPGCIAGFAEWGCTGVYGAGVKYDSNGQICLMPVAIGSEMTNQCACFSDGDYVTLYEWIWTNKDCDKEEPPPAPTNTPNPDPGKPDCLQPPLN